MKRLLIFTLLLYGANSHAQNSAQVVKDFGIAMQEWIKTDNIAIRIEKLDKITEGKTKCRINDEVTKQMHKKDEGLYSDELYASIYLDQFRDHVIKSSLGQTFQLDNIQVRPDVVIPTYGEELPSFVSADLTLTGFYNCNTTDLFFVRGNNITKIIDYLSEESLGKAIALYSQRKYDEAFRIFRKLAYADFTNFDAQYYTVVMELKKQGCGHLDKNFRDQELTWFILKNYYAANVDFINLMMRFNNIDDSKLAYAQVKGDDSEWISRFFQPASSGRMMSFSKKKNKCGFIDENGKLVIGYKYKVAFPFHDDLALVVNDANKIGFIDKDGKEVIPIIYKDAFWNFHKGRNFCLDADDNVVLIDKTGKVLKVIGHYKFYNPGDPIGQYVALFKEKGIFDVYDYDGNLVFSECDSWSANSKTGMITIKKNGIQKVEYKIEW